MGWIGGNVFDAPGLPKDMLEQEKLFITIEEDSYVTNATSLDFGTKRILKKKPHGEGKYFSWNYISQEESERKAAEDVKKNGFTISSGEGVLTVYKEDAWKKIEEDLHDKWYDEGLWE
jgi:hypothetical protein